MKLYQEACEVCTVLRDMEERSQPLRNLLDRTQTLWLKPSYHYIASFPFGGRKRREVRLRFLRTIWPVYRRWRNWVLACEAATRQLQATAHPQCPKCGVLMGWTHVTTEAEICNTCANREATAWQRAVYQRAWGLPIASGTS